MPIKKKPATPTTGRRDAGGSNTSAKSTVSAPARRDSQPDPADSADQKAAGTQALAAAMPFNANKAAEHGKAAFKPQAGASATPPDQRVTGSTLTERLASPKLGQGKPQLGLNPGSLPLDRVRVDLTGRKLLGVPLVLLGLRHRALAVGRTTAMPCRERGVPHRAAQPLWR